jgi:hypothetical protein
MRRALHLAIKKALSVVVSHYQVDFEAVSLGYVIPVGYTDVNSFELIKSKGNLAFPRKTTSPSGATTGGIPPPKKWPHFFAKPVANVLSTPRPKFWANLRGTRAAKGRRSASRG